MAYSFNELTNELVEYKVRNGGVYATLKLKRDSPTRALVVFNYNKFLVAEIGCYEGALFHPDRGKNWTILTSPGNEFRFRSILRNEPDPYLPYEAPITLFDPTRPLREHQIEMTGHMMSRSGSLIGGEMGTGKTLSWIEAIERLIASDPVYAEGEHWYVGPKAGVKAVGRELIKWGAGFIPQMFTYEGLKKKVAAGGPTPITICFDECSKLKTPESARSKAARYVADCMRIEWGEVARIIGMSGTPAPKTPVDWFHQLEVVRPGFMREGKKKKFEQRLCKMETVESPMGGSYPKLITWWDDPAKCASCGELGCSCGNYSPSKNEVLGLHKRMSGLVLIKFKKDCIDLPEKQYELIRIKPTVETLQAAKLIRATNIRAAGALTALRCLSDGFQYTQEVVGTEQCPECEGKGEIFTWVAEEDVAPTAMLEDTDFIQKTITCTLCKGKKEINKYKRGMDTVDSPKDDFVIEDLEAHEEIGRYIIWGGFTGTIDKLGELVRSQGWTTLTVDGRGYIGVDPLGQSVDDSILLDCMDASDRNARELLIKYPKVCFIGHPQAGGMALTLTASPTALVYSNCFSGEARMQMEDRHHRLGMDENRGCFIKDLIHLPSDLLVLENLKKKKKLQDITMGELSDAFENTTERLR